MEENPFKGVGAIALLCLGALVGLVGLVFLVAWLLELIWT